MEKRKLESGIRKLLDAHAIGLELDEMLELGVGGKQAKDGQIKLAIKAIRKDWKRSISEALARKMIAFSRRYTKVQLTRFIHQCRTYSYAPEFGVVIRLLPVKSLKRRNELQLAVVKNGWSKQDLEAELKRLQPKAQLLDTKGRGRKPRAVNSREALLGEARIDAVKWARILNHLDDSSIWATLTTKQQKNLKKVIQLLEGLAVDGS